ncbi:hypothetical protein CEXT_634761 [Caerostris extrusa]|uniref:Uncharacterized protein n=1 Tax=Caerostris extrusa TaxID=172846 RepID=A0AAV4P666_CAEEX|nr:hypothetical protein CEXT_634761 [Caerostris extrusa]
MAWYLSGATSLRHKEEDFCCLRESADNATVEIKRERDRKISNAGGIIVRHLPLLSFLPRPALWSSVHSGNGKGTGGNDHDHCGYFHQDGKRLFLRLGLGRQWRNFMDLHSCKA